MAARVPNPYLAACRDTDFPAVPKPPPPPTLRNETPLNQGKNLMKSAASLIGKEDDRIKKEFAFTVCQNFLHRHKVEDGNISWFYHNNDVEAFLQDGPTCGLVALKLAADTLKISPLKSTNEIEDLLKVAQENGFTYHGEMFSALDMGLLAKKFYELKFTVVNNGLEDYVQLVKHLFKGYPVLVPYDADRNHEPCLKRGHKAHWAVITGFFVGIKDDQVSKTDTFTDDASIHPFHFDEVQIPGLFETKHLFLLARQGKSRHYAVWCWADLNNSNKNLFEFDQKVTSTSEKVTYMFTEGVQRGLCSKVVLLSPQDKTNT